MSGVHSPLAPSSAARRIQCPGSLRMGEAYPEAEDSPKAIEGTLAHLAATSMLRGHPLPPDATEEMLDGAELLADTIGRHDGNHIEEQVDCRTLHRDCWGTPDVWRFEGDTLKIWDYKFGHRYVPAFENWQLLAYAAGITFPPGSKLMDLSTKLELSIIQPRCYVSDGPVRTWSLTLGSAMGYFGQLRRSCEAAMSAEAKCHAGEECQDCPARHACTTLQTATYAGIEHSGDPVPFDLPVAALGAELRVVRDYIARMEARASGLENEVLAKIKAGNSVPGWAAERGQGRKKWARPAEEIMSMGEMMGIPVLKPAVITPAQAIKAGLPAELVNSYTETPMGELKLILDSATAARRVFNKE